MEAVTTKTILKRDNFVCQYCGARAVQRDHLIKTRHLKRVAKSVRDDPKYQCATCADCNYIVYTRCFVPPSKAHLIDELQRITLSVYGVYSGDPAELRRILA